MKKIFYSVILTVLLFGCEDVIDVDVPTEAPRLTIDALIRVNEGEPIVNVRVRATLSSSFFDEVQPASLTQIGILNTSINAPDENVVLLSETLNGSGIYAQNVPADFLTEGTLILFLTHEDQRYAAFAEHVPAVPINRLEQGDGTLFSGEETEIMISFIDDGSRNDFYLFDLGFDEFLVTEDIFYQGQEFEFSYFFDGGIETGREIEISLLGVDFAFFNYMNLLIMQSGGNQGPFQTPVSQVRGNIINVTNVDLSTINSIDDIDTIDEADARENFALGYFAVSQTFKSSIIIE